MKLQLTMALMILLSSTSAFASEVSVGTKTQAEIDFNKILLDSGNAQKTLHNEFNRLAGNAEASEDQLDDGAAAPNEAMIALISK